MFYLHGDFTCPLALLALRFLYFKVLLCFVLLHLLISLTVLEFYVLFVTHFASTILLYAAYVVYVSDTSCIIWFILPLCWRILAFPVDPHNLPSFICLSYLLIDVLRCRLKRFRTYHFWFLNKLFLIRFADFKNWKTDFKDWLISQFSIQMKIIKLSLPTLYY